MITLLLETSFNMRKVERKLSCSPLCSIWNLGAENKVRSANLDSCLQTFFLSNSVGQAFNSSES